MRCSYTVAFKSATGNFIAGTKAHIESGAIAIRVDLIVLKDAILDSYLAGRTHYNACTCCFVSIEDTSINSNKSLRAVTIIVDINCSIVIVFETAVGNGSRSVVKRNNSVCGVSYRVCVENTFIHIERYALCTDNTIVSLPTLKLHIVDCDCFAVIIAPSAIADHKGRVVGRGRISGNHLLAIAVNRDRLGNGKSGIKFNIGHERHGIALFCRRNSGSERAVVLRTDCRRLVNATHGKIVVHLVTHGVFKCVAKFTIKPQFDRCRRIVNRQSLPDLGIPRT